MTFENRNQIKKKCGCTGQFAYGFFMIDKECVEHEKETIAAAERIGARRRALKK